MDIFSAFTWEDKKFERVDLSGQALGSRIFENCVFSRCTFNSSVFRETSFIQCSFSECEMSRTFINDCKLVNITFNECNMTGLDFSKCKKLLFSVRFEKCLLQVCNFSGLRMSGTTLGTSRLRECDFYDVDLKKADFSNCAFSDTHFESCELQGADFRLATGYAIDPTKNKIKNAQFSLPEVLSFLSPLGIIID